VLTHLSENERAAIAGVVLRLLERDEIRFGGILRGVCRLNPEMARLVVAKVSAPQA
jgi:hypothetical protein